MKLGFTTSACLCLLAANSSSGFVTQPQSKTSFTRVSASVADGQKVAPLIAPVDLKSLGDTEGATQGIYDTNVQTTYGRYPLTITKGKGCRLYTSDGKEYLDFVSGIATCALGHGNEELTKAISEQMSTVHHVSNLYYIPAQASLAKWLCDNSCADKVFFCNSGAESNEAAIKLARRNAYNRGIKKPVIITAHQSFHGRTLASLTATAQPKYHKGFGYGENGDMVQGFKYVTYNSVEELEQAVKEVTESSEEGMGLAAIMMEAIQGEGGIITGKPEFFKKARELCDKHNALLMCDEVQVGMGRTGTLWGWQQLGIEPDVFTSAKALGGGVPIGAMCAKGEAASVFGPGDHASTYGGNPLACRAGVTVADYITKNNVLQNVMDRGEQLSSGLKKLAEKYPKLLGEVRGRGLLLGIVSLDENIPAGTMVKAAMEEGNLLLVPAGPNVVRFVPPLIVTESDIDDALARFEKVVKKLAN